MASLTQQSARERGALIAVTHYFVELDLDTGPRTFESVSTIRFACRTPGAATFLDLKADQAHRITLNGNEIDPGSVRDSRVVLADLAAENEVTVAARMRYSNDGQGLHRAADPADGAHYVYSHLFLDAAPRVFACFDQPDLKAPYDLRVKAPEQWVVVGNGAASPGQAGWWTLSTTRPLATYFVAVCAGPYVGIRDEHDTILLGLHARRSLQGPLERHAPQILQVTRQSFDHYHGLFGIRYPYGEYHQVFVPEFNAGAMENPGCVVLRDEYLPRGASTRRQILVRSNTVAHEMAHMWFGDLVTMRWWDDLWLNESFAEYMAQRTLMSATELTDATVHTTIIRKVWGYAAERMPSTHPVAGSPAPDADTALQNFDGISYAKGAAALGQLIAYVGDEAFVAGVGTYLREFSYGNASMSDFVVAIERAADTDLSGWVQGWLRTTGRDELGVDVLLSGGRIQSAQVRRTPPRQFPADRPHATDVAGFRDGRELWRASFVVDADTLDLPELDGRESPTVVLPNVSDRTWAQVVLDDGTTAALAGQLGPLPTAQARAAAWSALLDGVATSRVDPRHVLAVFADAWPQEEDESILEMVALLVGVQVARMLPVAERDAAQEMVARAARELEARTSQGSPLRLVAYRVQAQRSADLALLRAWAQGSSMPAGLDGDLDFRWLAVGNLARRGAFDDAAIEAVLAQDGTMTGNLSALQAKASRPDADAKAWAWEQLTGRHDRSNYEMNALAAGFWHTPDLDLVRPYVPRYFTDVPAMTDWVGQDALAAVALRAYPLDVVEQATADATAEALGSQPLSPAVARQIADAHAVLREALESQRRYPPVGPRA